MISRPLDPTPMDLCLEFVSSTLLIPSLSSDPSQQKATLETAIGAVDLKALDAADQDKFDASLRKAHSDLDPLKPTLKEATAHLTGNSHIDAAWLWPWTETVDAVRRTFSTALQLMDEYPKYTYTQSAAQYNVWMAEKYPEMNEQIKQRIKEGRWEIVGGMWIEPDLNMPDGESLVRQLLIGKTDLQGSVWCGRAHRLESRFVRLQLATAADLQEIRRRLLRHPEDDLE